MLKIKSKFKDSSLIFISFLILLFLAFLVFLSVNSNYFNTVSFFHNKSMTEIVLSKENFDKDENIVMQIDGEREKDLQIEIKNSFGEIVEIDTQLTDLENGVEVNLLPSQNIPPGKYTAEVKNKKGIVLNKSFSWGVLAINVNQSIYSPGEVANISFAVLDEKGDMVCDADLELIITQTETGIKDTLTSQSGDIISNPECNVYGITYNPDYEASYKLSEPGKYYLELIASTDNGQYKISDYLEVRENLDFKVERNTATRIYPVVNYPVQIDIVANQDFKGQIVEIVPNNFIISNQEQFKPDLISDISSTEKKLIWNVDWVKGKKYSLIYNYDAPDVSPELFSIGPLTMINDDGDKVFSENRKWKIAVDAVAYDNVTTDSASAGRSSASFSHTVSGSNTLLLVYISMFHGSTSPGVTSVTYNGVSMSLVTDADVAAGSRHLRSFVYQLVNPASGTNTVAVTYAQSTQVSDSIEAISYTGVDQTTPVPTSSTNTSATAADPTVSLTTTVANSMVVAGGAVRGGDTAPFTPVSGTERWDFATFPDANFDLGTWGAELAAPTTTNYTVNATATVTDMFSMVAVEVAPVTASGITVSGNVYQSGTTALTACDGSTANIALRAGTTTYTTSCNASTGAWSIGSVTQPSAGDGLVVWIDGETTDGALVTRYDGTGDSTGNIFYANTVTFTSDDTTAVNNADGDTYDNANDADIPYTVSTNALTVNSGMELLIYNGKTYDPNGTVDTNTTGGNFHIDDNATAYIDTATSTIGADILVDAGGTLNIDATTNIDGGDITLSGSGSVTTLSGTPTTTISGGGTIGGGTGTLTFYSLTMDSTGTTALNASLTIANNLIIGDGTNAHTFDVETNDKAVDINGDLTVSANSIFSPSSTTNITIQGSFTNSGTINEGTSTIVLDGSTTANLNTGCSVVSSCTAQNLYNLTLNKSTQGTTVTLTSTGLRLTNQLTLTSGTLSQSNLDIQAEGSTAVSVSANGIWSNVSTGDIVLGGNVSNLGTITLQGNGVACADADSISITSSSGGTSRHWSGAGTFSINDVSLSDQSGTALINAFSSTDNGNNDSNWTILGGCSSSAVGSELMRHGSWFSGDLRQRFSF